MADIMGNGKSTDESSAKPHTSLINAEANSSEVGDTVFAYWDRIVKRTELCIVGNTILQCLLL